MMNPLKSLAHRITNLVKVELPRRDDTGRESNPEQAEQARRDSMANIDYNATDDASASQATKDDEAEARENPTEQGGQG